MARIVYIMGRGHSGTTFLDVLLGNAPNTESVGEVISGLNRGPDEICSCGDRVGDCDFWRDVASVYTAATGSDLFRDASELYRASDVRRFPKVLFMPSRSDRWYGERSRQLVEAIARVSGAEVVVDSNKEFTRAVELLRSDPATKVIHLYRRPTAVVASYYFRLKGGAPFKFMKREYHPKASLLAVCLLVAFSWNVGALLAMLIRVRYPRRVMDLAYESLVAEPEIELRNVAEFTGIELQPVIGDLYDREGFSPFHNIGGNELRHEGTFRFIRNVRGRRSIPKHYRALAAVLSSPGRALLLLTNAFVPRSR